MKKALVSILILFVILLPTAVYAENDANYEANVVLEYVQDSQKTLENFPEVGSKAVYIANPITGKVIYEKNVHEKRYPASTTKILTALVAMENCEIMMKIL